jgi:predicted lipoprotein with Yx(FWY)xxD motif
MFRPLALALLGLTAGLVLTGCDGTARTAGSAPTTKLAAVQAGPLGTVVTDADGHTLYRFDHDDTAPPATRCYDDCALRWPPALVFDRSEVALSGVDTRLVGTVTRTDGSIQLTLAGSPLYRYAEDTAAGDTRGHGADGTWFAITPAGSRAKESTA